MHSFFKHLNVGKFHKYKNQKKKLKKDYDRIQNDNLNVDGVQKLDY